MKRTNKFSFQNGILVAQCAAPKQPSLIEVNDNSELNRLLRIVFAPDDNGNVQGDLSLYMSKKASPEVIEFIKECLMQDLSQYREKTIPEGMSDDDFELFSRHIDESRDEYALRLRDLVDVQKGVIENAKAELSGDKKVDDV